MDDLFYLRFRNCNGILNKSMCSGTIKIKIRNFGPVKGGLTENDGFMDIFPVTVFCGEQATGKSTVAKIYSIMSWIEKTLVKNDIKDSFSEKQDIVTVNYKFFLDCCHWQKIHEYFSPDTLIQYEGTAYRIKYENKDFFYERAETYSNYIRPKIMYVPAERNLLAALEEAEKMKYLPEILSYLFDEYSLARKKIDVCRLPVSDIMLMNDKVRNILRVVVDENRSIPIWNASSGIQSVAPLSLVTRHISYEIFSKKEGKNFRNLSLNEREQLKQKFYEEMNICVPEELKSSWEEFSHRMFQRWYSDIRNLFNECFINIVEEPEQNLYPESQGKVLYELLEYMNLNQNNRLVITTHSPYILSCLTLCAKAYELLKKGVSDDKIDSIIPSVAAVPGNKIVIYENGEDGVLKRLQHFDNLPSDNNLLNNALNESNEIFASLIELEEDNGR